MRWMKQEPTNTEALFYLAAAEYAVHDMVNAEAHLKQVTAANAKHSQAIHYLALIKAESGNNQRALRHVALLDNE